MPEENKQLEVSKEPKSMSQIVGYLKDYPFLLITIAGLLILAGILIFDINKLKEFKLLIYAVVLVPLAIQFFIEYKKMQEKSRRETMETAPRDAEALPPETIKNKSLPANRKAWISVGISAIYLTYLYANAEMNQKIATGILILALVAAGLAFAANADANRHLTGSKGVAITGMVLSVLLFLFTLNIKTSNQTANEIPGWTPQEDSLLQGIQAEEASTTYTDTELADMASQINAGLPRMINDDTRLDRTVGAENILQYQYTLVNLPAANISEQILKDKLEKDIVNNVCTSKEIIKYFIHKGVTVSYAYYGSDGRLIGVISVGPSQC